MTPPPLSPPPPADEPQPAAARKTIVAASLLIAMFLFSGSLAVYSAWLLWRGEQFEPALSALPAGCDRVIFADKPIAAAAVAAALTTTGLQWTVGGTMAHSAQALQGVQPAGSGSSWQQWAMCGQKGGWTGALQVPATTDVLATQAASAWAGAVAVGLGLPAIDRWSERHGRWVGHTAGGLAVTVLRVHAQGAQAVWQPTDATAADDPVALDLRLDAVVAAVARRSLQKDEPFRAGLERAGGGDVHVFERAAAVRQLATAHWRAAVDHIEWRSVALTRVGDRLTVHEHLGGGQHLANWCKQHFDVTAEFDASTVIPADSSIQRWGVDRYAHTTAVEMDLSSAAFATRRAALPSLSATSDRQWQHWLQGPVAWFDTGGPCLTLIAPLALAQADKTVLSADFAPAQPLGLCPAAHREIIRGHLVVGQPTAVEMVKRALTAPAGTLADGALDRDAKRLAQHTNGWRSPVAIGIQVLEWTWLDTGIVVERSVALGGKP
ncbi:MAG: hypothetical protein EXR77_05800 [Myxococcales bacterium]|nr:hypothetical protein [Myxococcales bacterium]